MKDPTAISEAFKAARHNKLFAGIPVGDFEKMVDCLSAKTVSYVKDEIVLLSGDRVSSVGLVLRGAVRIIKEDIDGNTSIVDEAGVSQSFAEVFACAGIDHSPVTVIATERTEVLMLDFKRLLNTCSNTCPFHAQLIENMLRLVAEKAMALNQKVDVLSRRSTRDKLLCYFDTVRGPARRFTIPFNRTELANYLCVDRSAMSKELSRMRDEGLIRYEKNSFELL